MRPHVRLARLLDRLGGPAACTSTPALTRIAKEITMPQTRLVWLADALRDAGLTVVEIDGWKTRSRPASTGDFNPVGVLWHHTGDAKGGKEYADWLAKVGRSDLPAPLCHLSIGRDGTVYVIAAGRANHAGTAKPSGSVAGGDGNALYVGVECQNTGSEGWKPAQYDAMVTTGAVLGKRLPCSERAQRAHKETSVTGKWDPGALDMDKFRADTRRKQAVGLEAPKPAPVGNALGVMLAACHGPSLTVDHLEHAVTIANDRKLHSIKPSEAYTRIDWLKHRPHWSCIVGSSLTDRRRGPKDNPVLVSEKRARILESGAYRACLPAFPLRLAPERWNTWAVYETVPGGLLVLDVNIHPNPSVQSARPSSLRRVAHLRQMRKVERLVRRKRRAHGNDLHVVISGDVNSTATWTDRDSPASVFKRLGLHTYWHGILAIAYDPRLRITVDTIPASENGQDHPWLVATFKEKS